MKNRQNKLVPHLVVPFIVFMMVVLGYAFSSLNPYFKTIYVASLYVFPLLLVALGVLMLSNPEKFAKALPLFSLLSSVALSTIVLVLLVGIYYGGEVVISEPNRMVLLIEIVLVLVTLIGMSGVVARNMREVGFKL